MISNLVYFSRRRMPLTCQVCNASKQKVIEVCDRSFIPTCIIISQNTERMVESRKTNANDSKKYPCIIHIFGVAFCVREYVRYLRRFFNTK